MRKIRFIHWNPWVGCNKVSAGCKNCFILQTDFSFNGFENAVLRPEHLEPGSILMMLHSDFFLDKVDNYRKDAWNYIKNNPNYIFILITKRIERFDVELPDDWNDGYENVVISVTVENQEMADKRLPIFKNIKAKHKWLSVSPMLEQVNLLPYLNSCNIEHVEVTGEKAIGAAKNVEARELRYEWVEDLSNQCKQANVSFSFMSCGTNFKYNGKTFKDHCACYSSCLAEGLELDNYIPIEIKLQDSIKII